MKKIIVIPAYNEERTVAETVRGALGVADIVLVVDDGSTDSTGERAAAAGASVVRHAVNRGQGAAIKTGTAWALSHRADIVIHLDADGQHDASEIPSIIAPIVAGSADAVFGSRFLGVQPQGMPASRRLLLTGARLFNRLALGIPSAFTDPQSGFRALSAQAARTLDFRQDRMAHCSEILRLAANSGLRCVEVPVKVRYTAETLAKGQRPVDAFHIVWQLILGSFQR